MHPLVQNLAVSTRVDVRSVGDRGDLTVEQDAKPHCRALFRRSHYEVHIASMELVRNPAARTIEPARVRADSPVSRESPMVEPKLRRRGIGMEVVPLFTAAFVESGGLLVAEVAPSPPKLLPISLNPLPLHFTI